MTEAPYMLFDVFTTAAFSGNQLAIFPEASLDDATMQRVARELNLSETVFLSPAEDVVASLRIFTPTQEIPFAGHPTIGTAIALVDHLWWIGPNETSFLLRERVGDIAIAIDRTIPTVAWLTTPRVEFGREVARADAAAILGIEIDAVRDDLTPQFAKAGAPFLFVPLVSEDAVDRAFYDASAVRERLPWSPVTDVYLFAQSEEGTYGRMFAPQDGIMEDPATGSGVGPLYAYLAKYGKLPRRERYVSEQGVVMGRKSVLQVRLSWNDDGLDAIEIGGSAVFVGEGRLYIP
jgi:trans-2,3-dihydro-3-hydroxyanthranilate isomerase